MMSSDPTPEAPRVAALERDVRRLSAIAVFLSLGLVLVLVLLFYPQGPQLEGSTLTLRDARGARRIELGFAEDGAPMLRLNNRDQRARAMMFVGDEGRATFRLSDPSGKHRAQLLVEPDGRPVLLMSGRDGRSRVTLTVTADDEGELVLRDETGAQAARSR